ncbi:hypothetical protein B5M09_007260 [Aphanomyces astaci]|uniref:Uncharacterized protein n=1 Tax=Aphanomyces astaci TaxID=112090 RepID=A0A425CKB1_APHAT|nr:hypothetical protein B5M09_007260 [Aphanomyces astaci]
MPLMWGPGTVNVVISFIIEALRLAVLMSLYSCNADATTSIAGPFDVILCSDLIYGDTELADLLMATIRTLSHVNTLIVFAHEARYAGNQGRYFLDSMAKSHVVTNIPFDQLDPVYRSTNIHVHLIRSR